jgi:hypothetical protein
MLRRGFVAIACAAVFALALLPYGVSTPFTNKTPAQTSMFEEWVTVNLSAMQAPDATFASVERDLNAPVHIASLDGGQKFYRSDGCSTGCSTGCSSGCSVGCSSGCSSGCSVGCR